MRYIVMVKADADSEAGIVKDPTIFAKMTKFNQELLDAGILVSGEGLSPSGKGGARISFKGKDRKVVDGPFAEAKELVGGFWIWEVKSKEECIEWVKRIPFEDGNVEIRKIAGPEDFAEHMSEKLMAKEKEIFEKAQEKQQQK